MIDSGGDGQFSGTQPMLFFAGYLPATVGLLWPERSIWMAC